jgi:putative regulatory protein, FmdB family
MPLYEYRCESCGHQFEVIQKFSDAHVDVCPNCKSGPVVKLLSSPAIQFKGSGFYITDYARKGGEQGKGGEQSKSEDKGKASEKDSGKTPASTTTASSESTSTTPAPKADPKSST